MFFILRQSNQHGLEFIQYDLIRPQNFSDEAMAQARAMVESPPPDPDAATRLDLTHLKVYAVDSEDTTEVINC